MSIYLELVNNVLTRLNENNLDSSTFASARGIHAAAKIGVRNAVMRINAQKWEWPFNSANVTKTLTAGTGIYSFEADYKIADWESFFLVAGTYGDVTINTQRLKPIQRQEWFKWFSSRDRDHVSGGLDIPTRVFWTGDQKFGVTPNPNQNFILGYYYWITTTELTLYSDTVTIPTNFNWVVEQGALEDMYAFLDNDQRMQIGGNSFKDAIKQMALILIPQNISDMRDTVINNGGIANSGSGFRSASDPFIF